MFIDLFQEIEVENLFKALGYTDSFNKEMEENH